MMGFVMKYIKSGQNMVIFDVSNKNTYIKLSLKAYIEEETLTY